VLQNIMLQLGGMHTPAFRHIHPAGMAVVQVRLQATPCPHLKVRLQATPCPHLKVICFNGCCCWLLLHIHSIKVVQQILCISANQQQQVDHVCYLCLICIDQAVIAAILCLANRCSTTRGCKLLAAVQNQPPL
jgi:hypothetical protein